MCNNRSQIFVEDVSNIDCAIAIPECGPVGKSWSADISWEGTLDEEGVVFDFSLAKKAAKQTIENLLDHKILVQQDFATQVNNDRYIMLIPCKSSGGRGYFAVNIYANALALIDTDIMEEIKAGDRTIKLEAHIAKEIMKNSPANITNIVVKLKEHNDKDRNNYFAYTHSLKNHFGDCQKFHGHSNIIKIMKDGRVNSTISAQAASMLNNRYIVNKIYLEQDIACCPLLNQLYKEYPVLHKCRQVHYNFAYTGSQGEIAVVIPIGRTLLLESESTVEYLCRYVATALKLDKEHKVVAYEGLKKGAVS